MFSLRISGSPVFHNLRVSLLHRSEQSSLELKHVLLFVLLLKQFQL
jgi:hypothetical protein